MLHFLVKRYRQPHSWITVDTISLLAMRINLELLWDHYITAMWLSENNGHPPAIRLFHGHSMKPDDSAALAAKVYPLSRSEALHFCGLNQMISILSQILQNLNDSGVVGDRLSTEVPQCCWQYPVSCTGSHTEAHLLTSDTLHFNCFVFPSSDSTLYNINTADMACKLVWPYLFKVDSWFYPCLTPSRLTCSESLQPPWLQSTETF